MPDPSTTRLRAGALAIAALLTAFATCAHAQASPKMLEKAASVAQICQRHLGDLPSVAQEIKDAGFAFKGAWGRRRINLYTADGMRIIIGTPLTSDHREACLVYVQWMTLEQANQLIAPWLAATAAVLSDNTVPGGTAWDGKFQGTALRLGVINSLDTRLKGAAIVVARRSVPD